MCWEPPKQREALPGERHRSQLWSDASDQSLLPISPSGEGQHLSLGEVVRGGKSSARTREAQEDEERLCPLGLRSRSDSPSLGMCPA